MTDGDDDIPEEALAEAFDWLLALEAAPADERLRRRFEQWLHADARHGRAYRRAEHTWAVTGQLARREGADRPAERAERAPRHRRWSKHWPRVVAATAAMLALLVGGPRLWLAFQADYRTGVGETRTVALDDGSTVELNTRSAIRTHYRPDAREVRLLDGEAFFDVARDEQRPFRVHAGDEVVRVVGTAFNVHIDDAAVRVGVARGRVRVGTGRHRRTLAAGQRWRLDRESGVGRTATLGAGGVADWRDGRLAVADATVAEVAAELDRYHPGRIWLVGDRLARHHITGSYDLDKPEAALRAAVEPYGGRVQSVTPYLLLVSHR